MTKLNLLSGYTFRPSMSVNRTAALGLLIFFSSFFVSCNEESAVLPGIVRSGIEITTDPDGAKIFLNNLDKKTVTPASVTDVEPGFYKVVLTLPKYLDTTFYVLLKRGITDNMYIEMREDPVYWWKAYPLSSLGLPFDFVIKVRVDVFNRKWFATENNGILLLENGTWSRLTTSNSGLPDNRINDIFCSPDGLTWIATAGGLVKYDGTKFIIFNKANSNLPDDVITSVFEGKNSVLWAGTRTGGLIRYDGVHFNFYNVENSGLLSNRITAITCDTSGTVFAGTGGDGISVFNGKEWKFINSFFNNLRSDYVTSLLYHKGELWAGLGSALSPGGVSRIRGMQATNFNVQGAAGRAEVITDLAMDAKDGLWVSSADQGLFYMKQGSFIQYVKTNSGILSDEALSVTVDKDGDKWIGGSGISHYWGRK